MCSSSDHADRSRTGTKRDTLSPSILDLIGRALDAGVTFALVDGRLLVISVRGTLIHKELMSRRSELTRCFKAIRRTGVTLPCGHRIPRQHCERCITCNHYLPFGRVARCAACSEGDPQ